jgi:hypothetical protein
LSTPYDKSAAVVALPVDLDTASEHAAARRWLARSDLSRGAGQRELLARILGALKLPCPDAGLGALRLWGQTGDRPAVWIAAADPVYLEPRLDHLCLHALQGAMSASELGSLIGHLQLTLEDEGSYGFASVGACAYLRADRPVATATLSSAVIDGQPPDAYMPTGEAAAAYLRLRSEVEMALHEHEVNRHREEQGLPPVNGLWLWGGGVAPEPQTVPHPPLFGGDALLKGHWYSRTGVVIGWPGNFGSCVEQSLAGFVAVVPDAETARIEELLLELHDYLASGRLSRLTLMFRNGVEARLTRPQRWRIWRRAPSLPD